MASAGNDSSETAELIYEETKEIEDGKTVAVLQFADNPNWMDLPIGLIPEGTKEGDHLEINIHKSP